RFAERHYSFKLTPQRSWVILNRNSCYSYAKIRRGNVMTRSRLYLFVLLALALWAVPQKRTEAQTASTSALTGHVTSQEEGAMEGVLVSAKRAGSKITITVVSDEHGQYSFPRSRLEPGQYTIRIRAVGYDLENSSPTEVNGQSTATL